MRKLKFKELKDTNPMLERWSIKLSQYDFDVFYREGSKHVTPDCLSRDPVDVKEKGVPVIIIEEDIKKENLCKSQKTDENLMTLRELVLKHGTITFDRQGEIEES